jgi:ribosomal protein S18 acetylase RimI-like enzyme
MATPDAIWRLSGMSTTTTTPDLVHADATPLEDGARATTPDGDNIVLDSVRTLAAAYRELHQAEGHRVLQVGEATLTDGGSLSPFGNLVYLTEALTPACPPVVREALDGFYTGPGGPFIVFSPWATGDLAVIGLQPVGHPPLMVRWTPQRPPRTELAIRPVRAEAELADFERVLIEAYPVRELQPYRPQSFVSAASLRTRWRFYVGYEDGRPVACSAGFDDDRLTVVEMVAVRSDARGRGFGAAITAAAAGDDPERPVALIASDDGQGVYERLGFRRIIRYTLWVGQRP